MPSPFGQTLLGIRGFGTAVHSPVVMNAFIIHKCAIQAPKILKTSRTISNKYSAVLSRYRLRRFDHLQRATALQVERNGQQRLTLRQKYKQCRLSRHGQYGSRSPLVRK